ncbi:MAG: hydrogenase nickel incorporation protein HypB [bacterium]|nr:hydrogenase nickel incorporation protein HypB [bacterium]
MPHGPAGLAEIKAFENQLIERNAAAAKINREFFLAHRILALHLISTPGTGKTELLLATAKGLKKRFFMALVDSYGANGIDGGRYQKAGLLSLGISPRAEGRLDARLVGEAVLARPVKDNSLFFIEGSGGRPYAFDLDLGEQAKVMLFSPDQGSDKPLKLSERLKGADLVLLSKKDLVEPMGFDLTAFKRALKLVQPKLELIEVSALSGEGMDHWIDWIIEQASKLET